MSNVAIVVGHNCKKKGAYSPFLKDYEYDYYDKVAKLLKEKINVDVYYRKPLSYSKQMQEVVDELNKHKYDLIIELHFNSAEDKTVQGTTCLAHKNSKLGKMYATKFVELVSNTFDIKNRGLILIKSVDDRGGYGICKTLKPYILIEPFFGSNIKAKEFTVEKMVEILIKYIKEI